MAQRGQRTAAALIVNVSGDGFMQTSEQEGCQPGSELHADRMIGAQNFEHAERGAPPLVVTVASVVLNEPQKMAERSPDSRRLLPTYCLPPSARPRTPSSPSRQDRRRAELPRAESRFVPTSVAALRPSSVMAGIRPRISAASSRHPCSRSREPRARSPGP